MFSKMPLPALHHLQRRAGFGPNKDAMRRSPAGRNDEVEAIFRASRRGKELNLIDFAPAVQPNRKDLSRKARMQLRKERKEALGKLNHAWLRQMATEKAQLREKLTLFWHDHFACEVDHPFGMQDLNNVMRRHALGNFRALTLAVSRHPAMLHYLNNRQNRKQSPNENFARELMELFTIGRGHYTESDVKEAARAFTGWNFDDQGQFIFQAKKHDFGTKTFRGKTGNWGGEDIIYMLLEDRQTALHIAGKLYQFFVNDQIDELHAQELGAVLYDNDYEIEAMMRHLFLADWFWEAKNVAARIKSPVELLVGIMRDLNMDLPEAKPVHGIQSILGQILFHPPNVAGWPNGRAWIDSSTMLLRMTLPSALLLSSDTEFALPHDLMDTGQGNRLKKVRKINAQIDWKPIFARYRTLSPAQRTTTILADLLPASSEHISPAMLQGFVDSHDPESHVTTLFLQVLSLPEYQLT